MPFLAWTLAPVVMTAILPVVWPWRVAPERQGFWRRFVAIAALIAALVVGQTFLGEGPAAWARMGVFVAVATAYVYVLMRLDDMDGTSELFRWLILACLLTSAAALITLNSALGFTVSVCTMLFLGACMSLKWHQRVTLPLVAANVWLLQSMSATPPTLLQALSDGIGLLVMAMFGFILRRTTRLGQDLGRANRQLEQHAQQAEELATLRERARLARELHDTLGHALTTITVQLDAAERLLEKNPARAQLLVERSRDLSRGATVELRASLAQLRQDERIPLAEELRALSAQGGGEDSAVQVAVADLRLAPQQEHALARVAREALHNAHRHAHARQIQVVLETQGEAAVLRVEDDGTGFDPSSVPPGHYGLSGMQERLLLLGGRLDVRSRLGEGTTVTATLPLRLSSTPEVHPR